MRLTLLKYRSTQMGLDRRQYRRADVEAAMELEKQTEGGYPRQYSGRKKMRVVENQKGPYKYGFATITSKNAPFGRGSKAPLMRFRTCSVSTSKSGW